MLKQWSEYLQLFEKEGTAEVWLQSRVSFSAEIVYSNYHHVLVFWLSFHFFQSFDNWASLILRV